MFHWVRLLYFPSVVVKNKYIFTSEINIMYTCTFLLATCALFMCISAVISCTNSTKSNQYQRHIHLGGTPLFYFVYHIF